jgi:hypothetical protein
MVPGLPGGLGQTIQDRSRRRQVGVPHAQVDDIHTLGLDLGLQAVDLHEQVRGKLFKSIRPLNPIHG